MESCSALRSRKATLVAVLAGVALSVFGIAPAHADDVRDREYWLNDYGITKAWQSTKGSGVTVAVIDSGVDSSHQDLKDAVAGGTDVSGSGNDSGTKGIGAKPEHGTLVASLIAGRGHGGNPDDDPKPDGVVGVAPEAKLLTISTWLGSPNPSGKNVSAQIPEAVRWAVDHGAKVINMSLTSTSTDWPPSWDDAFEYAADRDVVVVAAVGNTDSGITQVGAPATIPGVVAVAGLKKDGTSSQGSSAPGITIALSAPAENLVGALPDNKYADWSGSSGAAPIVAGVAALIRSKYPDLNAANVINRLVSTAKPAGNPIPNNTYGYGLLDADAAVNAQVPVVAQSPLPSLAEWIKVHRRGSTPNTSVAPTPTPTTTPSLIAQEPAFPQQRSVPVENGWLPPTLVIGSAILLILIGAAGATHFILVARRRSDR